MKYLNFIFSRLIRAVGITSSVLFLLSEALCAAQANLPVRQQSDNPEEMSTALSDKAAVLLSGLDTEERPDQPQLAMGVPEFQKILAAAAALQAISYAEAESRLREWVQTMPLQGDPRPLLLLGHLLFEPNDLAKGFDWPAVGVSLIPPSGTTWGKWDNNPIVYVDGVPFAILRDAIIRPPASLNLNLCLDRFFTLGHWTSRIQTAFTEERFLQALHKLWDSPLFVQPLNEREKAALQDQFGIPVPPPALLPLSEPPPVPEDFYVALSRDRTSRPISRYDNFTYASRFNPQAYLEAAAALQALPQEAALAQLHAWAIKDDAGGPYNFESSSILCLMLFEARPGRILLHPDWLAGSIRRMDGQGGYVTREMMERIPAMPGVVPLTLIALVDGIPFLIVEGGGGSTGRGAPQNTSVKYFDYCRQNGQWTSQKYHPARADALQAALKKVQSWYEGGLHSGALPPPRVIRSDLPSSEEVARQFFSQQDPTFEL